MVLAPKTDGSDHSTSPANTMAASEISCAASTIPSTGELRRVLRLRDLLLLIVGTVIGSGIFLVPGTVLKTVGNSVPLALVAWIVGGVLSLLGALTFGELSAMNPRTGGLYVYIRDGFGRFPAFLFGWVLFFVVSTGSIATLAVAFSNYLRELLPFGLWSGKVLSLSVIGIIALANVRGTRQSADLQNRATVIKMVTILCMAGALLYFSVPSRVALSTAFAPISTHSLSAVALATVSVLWAYEGWQYATYAAGETLNPRRDFPLAFIGGVLVLVFLYILANLGYIAALGGDAVANSDHVASAAVSAAVSPVLGKAVTFAILISIFSAAHSVMLTAPRVYYAMAQDGLFFRRLAQVHPRFGTPAYAIAATALWAALLAISGTFEQLLTYVVFVGWAFYALAAASIFIYRRRETTAELRYRVPGYPWTPLLFIGSVAAVVFNTILTQPLRAAIGLAVIATGIPAYFIWRRT
jgi:basic amino acid/polyamine antiporter, APA family